MNTVQIVATGPGLTGKGIRSFESMIHELISTAEKELFVTAYVVTPSALPVIEKLETAARRGVKVTLLLNSTEELQEEIRSLLTRYHREGVFRIIDFRKMSERNIHAKIIISDRRKALVGSANLSWGGLTGNYEIGVFIEGEAAWLLANLFDTLISSM